MPALPARERILKTACRLFYDQGIRATGIDQIIAEAPVAKATFYYHFPAKTELVKAYLNQRHVDWMREFEERLAQSQEAGLAAIARALGRWFASGKFNGCAFINVTAESADEEWRKICVIHKDTLRAVIVDRLRRRGATGRALAYAADQALLVTEGLIVRYQVTGDHRQVDRACDLLSLIEARARVPLHGDQRSGRTVA